MYQAVGEGKKKIVNSSINTTQRVLSPGIRQTFHSSHDFDEDDSSMNVANENPHQELKEKFVDLPAAEVPTLKP